MKFLEMPFFFVLLLCSSTVAKVAAVNGDDGSATIHHGGPMRLGPAVSDFQVAEVQENSGLILTNRAPYFFRVKENNPSKERAIVAFIPSERMSLTASCIKALHAVEDFSSKGLRVALQTFPDPISKFLSSKSSCKDTNPFSKKTSEEAVAGSSTIMANRENHEDFMHTVNEIEVNKVLEIMDCDVHEKMELYSFQGLWHIIFLLHALIWILILICKLKIVPGLQQTRWQRPQAVSLSLTRSMSAHKKKLESNYSRFVINLVMIVVFIMAMGYIVSPMSIRTVEKLQTSAKKESTEFGVHPSRSRYLLSVRNHFIQTHRRKGETVMYKQRIYGASEHVDWPGESTAVASGGTVDMKLRIAVPVKKGFHEFIKMNHDSKDNHSTVTGFVIDVFETVMDALPYRVSCEFIPYESGHEDATGYYNNLIYQLNLTEQKYDGVVGDVTVTAKRLAYGDFTLPYMMSGVAMIVPIEDNDVNGLWWFFKPLSTEMWLLTIVLFLSKGILLWIFERGTNQEFQGTPSEQVRKILSSSILIFAETKY